MKRIYKNNDLIFNLTFNNLPIDLDAIDNIELKFYTINENNYIVKGINDIDDENQITLEWNELKNLERGVLYYSYHLKLTDYNMTDATLDTVDKVMTNYYIVTNINQEDNLGESYYTKEEVDDIVQSVVVGSIDLSGYYTKEQLEYILTSYLKNDTLGSYYTKNEVNDLIDGIDIPTTDLSDYYTKGETYSQSEVNALIDSVNSGDVDLTNYYTKSEVDAKIPKNYITSIPSEYITESELNAKGYLTQHQSLSNYYNKGEVDTKLKGYSTSGHTHSQYLTQQSLSGYAKLTDIPTDYVTESKLNTKGYLTAVPSEYITETELEAKGYLTAVPKEYITEAELEAKDYISIIPSEYITESELNAKGYITEHQSLTNYYTKNEVNNLIDGVTTSGGEVNLTNYYTKSEVNDLIEDIEIASPDLTNYYTKNEVNNLIDGVNGGEVNLTNYYTKEEVDSKIPTDYLKEVPSEYVTETELQSKGYLTQHQSLTGYAKLTDIPSLDGYAKTSDIPTDYLKEVPSEYVTESELQSNYYNKGEVDELIANIDIPTGTTGNSVDMSDYYTKTEIDTVMLTNHLSDIYAYNGTLYGMNITGNDRNEIKFKTINGQVIIGQEGDIVIPEYDDTALTNRVSALESELTGVSELISRLNDLIV